MALLVAPPLLALIDSSPSGRTVMGVQVQVPAAATMAAQIVTPLAVTVTGCPATPVP